MTNAVDWPEAVWQEINDAVLAEVSKVRTAQKVFPTSVLDGDPTEVANDVIEFPEGPPRRGEPRKFLSIREGRTKPFVEIYLEFPLTAAQVARETQLKTCKTSPGWLPRRSGSPKTSCSSREATANSQPM